MRCLLDGFTRGVRQERDARKTKSEILRGDGCLRDATITYAMLRRCYMPDERRCQTITFIIYTRCRLRDAAKMN